MSLESEECAEKGQRFHNPYEWILISWISLIHLALGSLIWMIIWMIMETWGQCNPFRFPSTFFAAIRKCHLDYQLFNIMAWPNRDDDDETRKIYKETKESLREQIESHQLIMALSKIIESAFESGFQFFFQSVFTLPSFLLSITSQKVGSSWKDLVNWATASIALSFLSFAWTYSTIR